MDDLLLQSKIGNRLLAAQLRGTMEQHELVRLLMTTGASDRDIADILDTTRATVSVTKGRLRKKAAKKAAKKSAKKASGKTMSEDA